MFVSTAWVLCTAEHSSGCLEVDSEDEDTVAQWDKLSDLPNPRAFHTAAVVDSSVYLMGGNETVDSDTTDAIWSRSIVEYDVLSDEYSTVLDDVPDEYLFNGIGQVSFVRRNHTENTHRIFVLLAYQPFCQVRSDDDDDDDYDDDDLVDQSCYNYPFSFEPSSQEFKQEPTPGHTQRVAQRGLS